MKHRTAIACLLLIAALAAICACEHVAPEGVPMEQSMCLRSRWSVVVVDGDDNRRIYEKDICPIHRRPYHISTP